MERGHGGRKHRAAARLTRANNSIHAIVTQPWLDTGKRSTLHCKNGIKTRVVDASEDIATPQHPASTPGSQPLSRQQLQQLQYDALATSNTTRPQNWSGSSLEDNLDNLQLDNDEATASVPAPARVTPNVTTRSMARSAASNSQLNSIEAAEVNATHQSRPPLNSRGRQEAKPRSQSNAVSRRYPSNSRDKTYQNSDNRTSRRDNSYSRPSPEEITAGMPDVQTVATDALTAEADVPIAGTALQ
jgi:hypothetical protein